MKERTLKKALWWVNAALFLVVAWTAWQVFQGQPTSTPGGTRPVEPSPPRTSRPQSVTPVGLSRDDIEKVFSRNFSQRGPAPAPTRPSPSAPTKAPGAAPTFAPVEVPQPGPQAPVRQKPPAAPLASLIRLVAVFQSQDPFLSSVVVENLRKQNRQELYWYGDKLPLPGNPKLFKVGEQSASFRYCGQTVELRLQKRKLQGPAAVRPAPPAPSARKRPPYPIDPAHHRYVPRQEVMQAMAKPLESLRGVRYRLVEKSGRVQGFMLNGLANNPLLSRYGVQENDIVTAINGKQIDENFNPFSTLPQLMSSSLIQLKLLRNNQEILMSYELK